MHAKPPPIVDHGPWSLFHGGAEGRLVGVVSNDFKHDVLLRVEGDFGDEEQKLAYCEWLLGVLNTNATSDARQKRSRALDELVRLSEQMGLYDLSRPNPLLCRHDDSSWCTDECRAKALALRVIREVRRMT